MELYFFSPALSRKDLQGHFIYHLCILLYDLLMARILWDFEVVESLRKATPTPFLPIFLFLQPMSSLWLYRRLWKIIILQSFLLDQTALLFTLCSCWWLDYQWQFFCAWGYSNVSSYIFNIFVAALARLLTWTSLLWHFVLMSTQTLSPILNFYLCQRLTIGLFI